MAPASVRGDAVYSVRRLAKALNLSVAVVYKALHSGAIPSVRFGRRYIIPKAAVARWLESAGSNVRDTKGDAN